MSIKAVQRSYSKYVWLFFITLFLVIGLSLLIFSQHSLLKAEETYEPLIFGQDDINHRVIDITPRPSSNADRPDETLTISMVNLTDFEEEDIPTVGIFDYKYKNDRGEIEILPEGHNYDYGASAWIEGPNSIINLENEAVNPLEFNIFVPEDIEESTNYTAAFLFLNKDQNEIGRYTLIINLNRKDEALKATDVEVDLTQSQFDFEEKSVGIAVRNEGQWAINPRVFLDVENVGDNRLGYRRTLIEEELQSKADAILSKDQQIYTLQEGVSENFFEPLLDSSLKWRAKIRILGDNESENDQLVEEIEVTSLLPNNLQGDKPIPVEAGNPPAPTNPGNEGEAPVAATDNNPSPPPGKSQGAFIWLGISAIAFAGAIFAFYKFRSQKQMISPRPPTSPHPPTPPQPPGIPPQAPIKESNPFSRLPPHLQSPPPNMEPPKKPSNTPR